MAASYKGLVKKIHESKCKVIMAVTGGGTESIGEMCRYGGASDTLIEANICYANESFNAYIQGKPDKYVSEDAAAQLATAGYMRAVHNYGVNHEHVVSVGATSSLGKAEPEREGRKHRICVAYVCKNLLYTRDIEIQSLGMTREEEEDFTTRFILKMTAFGCQVLGNDAKEELGKNYTVEFGNLYSCGNEAYKVYNGSAGHVLLEAKESTRLIFPGSFNPIHEGHLGMIAEVNKKTGKEIDLEVSIHNVDKPFLTYKGLNERLATFLEAKRAGNPINGLLVSNAPRFKQKVSAYCHYPEETNGFDDIERPSFIMGADTLSRIFDANYYVSHGDRDEAVRHIETMIDKWHIFPREGFNLWDIGGLGGINEDDLLYYHDFKSTHSSSEIRKKCDFLNPVTHTG